MDVNHLLFRKHIYQGNFQYSCGDYFDAYLSYKKAASYEKSRLTHLLMARSLYQLNQYKQCFANIQIALKLNLGASEESQNNLRLVRAALLKFMTPYFVMQTIDEDYVLESVEDDYIGDFDTESILDQSIDMEKRFEDSDCDWIDDSLPEPAVITEDCTDDLLREHLWGLEEEDDGWDSDETLTAATVIDSDFDSEVDGEKEEVGEEKSERDNYVEYLHEVKT